MRLEYKGPVNYSKEEFEEMELNPFGVPKGAFIFNYYDLFKRRKVFSHIPTAFKKYKSWLNSDLDLLLKTIVVMVDTESPMAEETDFEYRKVQAVMLTGANDNEAVLEEIDSEGMLFSSLVFNFFKSISDMDYQTWFSMKQLYDELCKQARMPMPAGADAGVINARMKLPQAIMAAESELRIKQFNLFKSKRLERILIEESGKDEIGGYPEEFGEDPEWKKLIHADGSEEENN